MRKAPQSPRWQHRPMPNRTRLASETAQATRAQLITVGRELRVARLTSGRRQVDVGEVVGMSSVHVSRVERGVAPGVRFRTLTAIAAAVGLKLWVRAYPAGRRLLDAPQLGVFTELKSRTGDRWRWRTEVPMPIAGDLRAADAVGTNGTCTVLVELITRLVDYQAQSRAAMLKKRDLPADRVILVIRGSHANRRALAEAGDAVRASFPLATRPALRAMSRGADPGGDAIVVL